ncbi:MAG: DUF1553 domain-containing protein [Verrucomicrobia bacterium]|nr:DUF1553 domain-containing protein [Verrucomicrobiota bacterium]
MSALIALAIVLPARAEKMAASGKTAVPAPPVPAIRALKLEPASLTLHDGRDERRVLVWGKTDSGQWLDLTSQAILKSDSLNVEINSEGFVHAKNKGAAVVTVSAAGKQIKLPVTVESATVPEIRFVRDIEPVLSKVGCNAGTCHGSAKGKNGFKLSLRGYDPDYDYQALVNDLAGRRINRAVVDDSLMLLKPIAEVPHEGRQAIKPGSRYHQMLRQWLVEGAKTENPTTARAKEVEVLPADVEMDLPGRTQQILVLAHYPDNSVRDVTREAVFTSNNGDVAEVKDGVVTGVRRGEAAILIRYEGIYAAREVRIMGDRSGFQWAKMPENNYIDQHVNAKLKRMKILPSELCTDAEFIRRVSLDLTGLPPTPERVRVFLNYKSPTRVKRDRLIDELLESKDYVTHWANKWADLLQCNSERLGQKGMWVFRDWIKQSIAQNKPYDRFVRELLTSEGSCYQNPAVNYYRVLRDSGKMTEDISQTFLGTRFNCNKCHDHPFEKWTQSQYYELGAFFAKVSFKKGPLPEEEVVYRNYSGGEVKYLKNDMVAAAKVPFGKAESMAADADRREALADWLTARDNPLFAKSYANRVWSYFLGRGIIEPVDDIRAGNPPSNPELLDALTKDFLKNNFDAKKLMRTICQSRTYQLSIKTGKWNEDDKSNFSHAAPRRLSAEQLMDAVALATGSDEKFKGMPQGMSAGQVPDGTVAGNDFLALFGRPKRQSACECERTSNITLSHAINMINGDTFGEAISAPNNRIAKLVKSEKDDKKVVEELYLAILCRLPTEKEMAAIDFSAGGTRLEVAQDLAWALLNSPAFLFNR